MKVLVMGLPGAGKTTFASGLARLLNAVWWNADAVRDSFSTHGMTRADRILQAGRMAFLCDQVTKTGAIAVADFVCPLEACRIMFNADYTVWLDTINEGRFDDTNKMFEPPLFFDMRITTKSEINSAIERCTINVLRNRT